MQIETLVNCCIWLFFFIQSFLFLKSMRLGYRVNDQGSFPGRSKNFPLHNCTHTGFGVHPASYPMGALSMGEMWLGHKLTTHFHLVHWLGMCLAVPTGVHDVVLINPLNWNICILSLIRSTSHVDCFENKVQCLILKKKIWSFWHTQK
jgi:hypothetical protein